MSLISALQIQILFIVISETGSPCGFENIFGNNEVIFMLNMISSAGGVWHGMSRTLLHGPTRIVPKGFSKRIATPLAYLTVGCATAAKVGTMVSIYEILSHYNYGLEMEPGLSGILAFAITFPINMALAIFGLVIATGCNRKLLSIIIAYPMLLLLPMFSPFVVSTQTSHHVPKGKFWVTFLSKHYSASHLINISC